VCSPAHADCVAVPGIPQSGTGCAVSYPPAPSSGGGLALDGSTTGNGGSGTVTTGTLGTTGGSGEILVTIASNATTVSSVAAGALTCTSRSSVGPTFGYNLLAVYGCPYSTNYSGTITVVVGSASSTEVVAFGVKSATTFDTGGPATSTNPPASITTTHATDFVYSLNSLSTTTDTAGSGWTLIASASFALVQYQIASSTGTFTGNTGGGNTNGNIIDAIH
jgi:hypothetical protein